MKFIDNFYDKEVGRSVVIMEHRKKRFVGKAFLSPDDEKKASEYVGCAYAETRAVIKALKYERKILKEDAETCRKFIKACECYKGWDQKALLPVPHIVN